MLWGGRYREKSWGKLFSLIITVAMVMTLFIGIPIAASANSDIYVYDDQYTIWDGDYENWDQSEVWYPVDEANPISGSGQVVNRNLYLIDDTDLYFDDLDLGTGGLYTHTSNDDDENCVCIEGGTLKASEINVCEDLWIGEDARVIVKNNITAGYEVYSYGGVLAVGGDIIAPRIWFDSDDGPLYVTVGGSIKTYSYEHYGGSVNINGSLDVGFFVTDNYPTEEDWDSPCDIRIDTEYAEHNFTELRVGGDMISQLMFVGVGGMGISSEFKPQSTSEYDDIPILVNVKGNIQAKYLIAIERGIVTCDGTIQTTDDFGRTIYIFGGKVEAKNIVSATAIYIGDSEDGNDTNDEIVVNVTGDITAAYEISIEGKH